MCTNSLKLRMKKLDKLFEERLLGLLTDRNVQQIAAAFQQVPGPGPLGDFDHVFHHHKGIFYA